MTNNPIAVFEYGKNARNVILELKWGGKNFLVGVHFNQNRGGSEISSIRGLFPKDNAEWLNWISQGKAKYINYRKLEPIIKNLQEMIDKQRINPADVAYLDLEDVANIVNNFENPDISDVKKESRWSEEDFSRARKNYSILIEIKFA